MINDIILITLVNIFLISALCSIVARIIMDKIHNELKDTNNWAISIRRILKTPFQMMLFLLIAKFGLLYENIIKFLDNVVIALIKIIKGK